MKTVSFLSPLLALPVAAALCLLPPAPSGQDGREEQTPASALRIAVMDLQAILDGWGAANARLEATMQRLQEEYRGRMDELRREQEEVREKLSELEAKHEAYLPGTLQHNLMTVELNVLSSRLGNLREVRQLVTTVYSRESDKRYTELMAKVVEDIQKAVAEVAQGRGIDLVLMAQGPGTDPEAGDRARQPRPNHVLYHHPRLDITPAVLDLLNAGQPGR